MKYFVLVLLAGCHSVSPAQLAEIDQIFATANASDSAGDRAFATAAKNLATLVPSSAPCRVRLSDGDTGRFSEELASVAVAESTGQASGNLMFQAEYVTFARGPLDGLGSASRAVRRHEEERLRAREDDEYRDLDGDALIARAKELVAQPLLPELLIVIEHRQEARSIDRKSFVAGSVAARAYLYDEKKFVCAGVVDAKSSPTIEIWYTRGQNPDHQVYLSGDLYLNLLEAAKKSLRAL